MIDTYLNPKWKFEKESILLPIYFNIEYFDFFNSLLSYKKISEKFNEDFMFRFCFITDYFLFEFEDVFFEVIFRELFNNCSLFFKNTDERFLFTFIEFLVSVDKILASYIKQGKQAKSIDVFFRIEYIFVEKLDIKLLEFLIEKIPIENMIVHDNLISSGNTFYTSQSSECIDKIMDDLKPLLQHLKKSKLLKYITVETHQFLSTEGTVFPYNTMFDFALLKKFKDTSLHRDQINSQLLNRINLEVDVIFDFSIQNSLNYENLSKIVLKYKDRNISYGVTTITYKIFFNKNRIAHLIHKGSNYFGGEPLNIECM
ncbi:hypothetical protein CWI39_0446p0010 [Hamiltosporidium magnivora]|uniref:Uncharacterized protein n=1 Tax=Hamiltosporidium magnivora TaxID=148818 RepID=A0A4Q9LHI9_9MICR|nr:hypothetical protein CWI39_0446p0010 [Hamiltosporidium magnivora]